MMPHLSRPLVQVLVFWVMRELQDGASMRDIEQSRGQVIAFILFWYLCRSDPNRASKECIAKILAEPSGEMFPGHKLYSHLTTTDESVNQYASMRAIFTPDEIEDALDISSTPILRSFHERFKEQKEQDAPCRGLLEKFWWDETLLLWLQRKYLSKKFTEYKALAEKDDDDTVPYDYDHLCPKDEWRCHYSNLNSSSPELTLSEKSRGSLRELWRRDHTGNSIGNYHILDASDNRSYGNDSVSAKITDLESSKDWCFADSALPEQDRDIWLATSSPNESKYCWTDARVAAFQEAVDRRVLHLYKLYYAAVKEILADNES